MKISIIFNNLFNENYLNLYAHRIYCLVQEKMKKFKNEICINLTKTQQEIRNYFPSSTVINLLFNSHCKQFCYYHYFYNIIIYHFVFNVHMYSLLINK